MPCGGRSCWELSAPYGLPRSVGMLRPAAGGRWQSAIGKAWCPHAARLGWAIAHPTTAREPSARTTARYRQPSPGAREGLAPTYRVSGACPVNARWSCWGATAGPCPAAVGAVHRQRVWQRRPAGGRPRPRQRRRPPSPCWAASAWGLGGRLSHASYPRREPPRSRPRRLMLHAPGCWRRQAYVTAAVAPRPPPPFFG